MIFTHSQDPSREARITLSEAPGGARATVEHADAAGKARRKSFTKKSKWGAAAAEADARATALRFLLKEGFLLRGPQADAMRWMRLTEERFPHGYPFTLDRAAGVAWVADTGALRRVTPGSCAVQDLGIGAGVMPRAIGWGGGQLYAVLDLEEGAAAAGAGPWRPPSKGQVHYGLVRAEEGQLHTLAQVAWAQDSIVFERVSVTDDGRVLGPHAQGASLYTPEGQVLEAFAAARTEHTPPKAAVSPGGRFVATTGGVESLRLHDLEAGTERCIPAAFSQVHELEVDDAGVIWVRGFQWPSWGYHRVTPDGEVQRVSAVLEATRLPDGRGVAELAHGALKLRALGALDAEPFAELPLPWLPMGRYGRALSLHARTLIVRSDAHALAGIDLGAVPGAL